MACPRIALPYIFLCYKSDRKPPEQLSVIRWLRSSWCPHCPKIFFFWGRFSLSGVGKVGWCEVRWAGWLAYHKTAIHLEARGTAVLSCEQNQLAFLWIATCVLQFALLTLTPATDHCSPFKHKFVVIGTPFIKTYHGTPPIKKWSCHTAYQDVIMAHSVSKSDNGTPFYQEVIMAHRWSRSCHVTPLIKKW
jgi:hypothetical protein